MKVSPLWTKMVVDDEAFPPLPSFSCFVLCAPQGSLRNRLDVGVPQNVDQVMMNPQIHEQQEVESLLPCFLICFCNGVLVSIISKSPVACGVCTCESLLSPTNLCMELDQPKSWPKS